MKRDIIYLTANEYTLLAFGITRMKLGLSNGFYVESLNLFLCHYDKKTDSFSVDIEDIPAGAFVLCCFPKTAKELYGLDTVGDWDLLTNISLNKQSLTLSVYPVHPKS